MLSSLPLRAPSLSAPAICAFLLLLASPATPAAQKGAAKGAAKEPPSGLEGFPQLWTGPELSADYVSRNEDGTTERTRLYFGKDKMRWEAVEGSKQGPGGPGGIVILDYAKGAAYMVDPAKKQYMEGPELSQMLLAMMGAMRIVMQPADINNPCLLWLGMAAGQPQDQVSCKSKGSDAVNGRSAQKYELADAKNERAQLWLDNKTRLLIRVRDNQTKDGFDVENLREGTQPASLFEVPAGYNKVDVSFGSLLGNAFKGRARAGNASGAAASDSGGKGVGGAVKDAGKDVAGAAGQATKDAAKEAAKEKVTKKVRGIFKVP